MKKMQTMICISVVVAATYYKKEGCDASDDSCDLTVDDFIQNQPVANMTSLGRAPLRLSSATTARRVESMLGGNKPLSFIVINSDT